MEEWMSTSTHRTLLTLGERTMREFNEREEELTGQRDGIAERLCAERAAEYERLGHASAHQLGELCGRYEAMVELTKLNPAMAEVAPPELLAETRGLLDGAVESNAFDSSLAARVEAVEETMFERWGKRETCSLAMAEVNDSGLATVSETSLRWEPDGRLVAFVDFGEEGRMPVSARADGGLAGRASAIDWEASHSDIAGPDGTQESACDRQASLVRGVAERIDMRMVGEGVEDAMISAEARAGSEATRRRR